MSAFTPLSQQQLASLLEPYRLRATDCRVASEGIENSNFFVRAEDCDKPADDSADGKYRQHELVLTILENIPASALGWFIDLLSELESLGLPVARPLDSSRGPILDFQGKPVLLVPRLSGSHVDIPTTAHCQAIGTALATLHGCQIGRPTEHDGPAEQLVSLVPLLGKLTPEQQHDARPLLEAWSRREGTPVLCHGDLFRDNALFEGDRLSGLLDFYNAGHELAVWDLAVASNDWCVRPDGRPDPERERALLIGYGQTRTLPMTELALLPLARTIAALRFWLSRLRETPAGAQGQGGKDPEEFARIYRARRERLA